MFKRVKTGFSLIVTCFVLLSHGLFAQNKRAYLQDSLKIISLLATADNCIKSASSNCNKPINDALKMSTALGSPFLKSLCYRSFANAERRNRTALLFKYDSLGIVFARLSQNDSLLIHALLTHADDFSLVNTPDKGKRFIDESLLLLKKNDNNYLMMLAKYEQGFYCDKNLDFVKANNNYKQALTYAKELNNEYWVARLYKSISFLNAVMKKRIDSSTSIFDALDYFKKNDAYEVANCLAIIGYAYRQNGNLEKASGYFNDAAAIYQKEKYPANEAEMYVLLAEKFIEKKDLVSGLNFTRKAEKIYSAIGYEYGVNYAHITNGRLFGAAGDWINSNRYFNRVDSVLKIRPNKRQQFLLLSAKVTTNVYNGNAAAVSNIIDSAAKMTVTLLPKELTGSMIDHATSTGLLSVVEAIDLKKYSRTGKLDIGLWNKKQDLEGMNPYTIDLPRFNNQYNELFNRQTTEMETRYRTKIKDDSLKNVINENRISQLKINRQNSLILLIAIISIIIGIILYLINRIKEKVVQEKKTIELLKVEADHRVKNTFNVINTIVRSVKSQSSDKQSFEVLEGRVEPLMILYDMLNQKNVQDIYLQDYFERICNNLRSSYTFSENIQVHIDAPVMLDGKKAGTVGLMVNELVTNAFKHAFPQKENQRGEIWVACKKDVAGGYNLHVSDSGIGFKETVVNINSKGLMHVKALAEQLAATINEKHDHGVFFDFYFM